jgi:hypothetical protein
MENEVKCPKCGHQYDAGLELSKQIEAQLRNDLNRKYVEEREKLKESMRTQEEQMREREKQIEAQGQVLAQQIQQQEALLKQRLQEAIKQKELELKTEAEKGVAEQVKMLEEENRRKDERLNEATRKEVEMLRKEHDLRQREEAMRIESEKLVLERSKEIEDKARKQEQERLDLQLRERDKTIDDLRKMMEEMKRKSEQGSMQLQGEVQELALEELLRNAFPFDKIEEVGKGVRGADCTQTVRNDMAELCGTIIYESKRTKAFSRDWIEKLKADLRQQKADVAVLVTEAMPPDMDRFGEREGIWICSFAEARGVASVLRDGLMRVHAAQRNQENKGEKMNMLYHYLTGNEFRQQMNAIVEGFMNMKNSLQKERLSMEKLWKEREKQLDLVLLNATHFYGSVRGIAGSSVAEIKLLEGGDAASDEQT